MDSDIETWCNSKHKFDLNWKICLFKVLLLFGMMLIVMSCCGLAYGADTSVANVKDSFSEYVNTEDLSFRVLKSVFGRVGGVSGLSFAQSTVFGVIFKTLSYGALFIESIMLIYMVGKIITEANIDSNGMSRSTMLWTPIRCALSTTLLIPSATTGYSMIHSIVMLIVIQGVGLANMLWGNVTQFLVKENQPFYNSLLPVSNGTDAGSILSKMSVPDPSLISHDFESTISYLKDMSQSEMNVGSADIMRSMLCTHAIAARLDNIRQNDLTILQRYQEEKQKLKSANDSKTAQATSISVDYSDEITKCIYQLNNSAHLAVSPDNLYNDSETDGLVSFPGTWDLSSYQCVKQLKPVVGNGLEEFPEAASLIGLCGSINYGTNSGSNAATTSVATNSEIITQLKRQTLLSSIVPNMSETAKQLIKARVQDSGTYRKQAQEFVKQNYPQNKTQPCYSASQSSNACSTTLMESNKLPANAVSSVGDVDLPLSLLRNAYGYQLAIYSQLANNLVTRTRTPVKEGSTSLTADDLYKLLNNQGWMFLGNYYWLISNVINSAVKEQKGEIKGAYLQRGGEGGRSQELYQMVLTDQQQKTLKKILGGSSGEYYGALKDTLLLVNAAMPVAQQRMNEAIETTSETTAATQTDSTDKIIKTIQRSSGLNNNYNYNYDKQVKLLGTAAGLDVTHLSVIFGFNSLPLLICVKHISTLVQKWVELMVGSGDPIVRVEQLGRKMVDTTDSILTDFLYAIIVYTGASTAIPLATTASQAVLAPASFWGTSMGFITLLQTIADISVSGAQMGMQFFTIFLPLIMGIAVPLFTCGILLSIYVPLIPTLLFIFGGMSWIISVIVLLVAAPIICFLMLWGGASQENPLLSREAEQFIQQLIGSFFRPALMVVGFIGGMLLSYIGFDILNMAIGRTYRHFFSDKEEIIFYRSEMRENAKNIGMMVRGLGFMGVYTYAAVSIVNMSFSLIHLLYSETMRVVGISAPAVGLEERHAEAAKTGATQFGEAGASGVRGVGEGAPQRFGSVTSQSSNLGKNIAGIKKAFEEQKEKKEGSKISVDPPSSTGGSGETPAP